MVNSSIMSPFLQLVFELIVILLVAKIAGYISMRLGQPSVLGELIAGVLLGPTLLNIIGLSFIKSDSLGGIINELSDLGVLLLMFIAGLELHFGELTSHFKTSFLSSLGGFLLSLGLGWGTGRIFGFGNSSALLMGLALAATSVSISARTLMEMGMLRSRVGLSLLGAAVVDDILAILAFSTFLAISSGGGGWHNLAWTIAQMVIYLLLAVGFGIWVLPALARRISKLEISQGLLAFAIVILLSYGLAAELVGNLAAIIGSFLAGLMFSRTPEKGIIEPGIKSLAYALFVPIFFINIGLSINLRTINYHEIGLILGISAAAVIGKLLGSSGGGRISKLETSEAFQLGAGMIPRGEVTLIIAATGSKSGLIGGEVFSSIVAVVLLTTLITPPMLHSMANLFKRLPSTRINDDGSQK